MSGGIEKLIEQAAAAAGEMIREVEPVGDSHIEKLLYTALVARVQLGLHEFRFVETLRADDPEPTEDKGQASSLLIMIRPQVVIERRRVDFVVYTYDHRPRILQRPGWRKIIVECDGHEFHERTKEQAKRDRSRDRAATVNRQEFLRFTGSEIWNDPFGCAGEILDLAAWSFG